MTASLSGQMHSFDNRKMRSGNPRTANKKLYNALRALAARFQEQGFPIETKFTTAKEVADYFGGECVVCLRCGKPYRSLAAHITRIHGWTADEYKEFYGLPWRTGLSCKQTKGLRSESTKRAMDAGFGLGALSKADRESALALSRKAKRRAKTASTIDSCKKRFVALTHEAEYTQADYDTVLRLMIERDQTLKEVVSSGGLPSRTMFYGRIKADPEFAERYATTIESLSFAAQKRGTMLGRRFHSECVRLRSEGKSFSRIAATLNVSAMTVFKCLRDTA